MITLSYSTSSSTGSGQQFALFAAARQRPTQDHRIGALGCGQVARAGAQFFEARARGALQVAEAAAGAHRVYRGLGHLAGRQGFSDL